MLFEGVFGVAGIKLGRGGIQGERDVLARLVTGVLDRLDDGFQRVFNTFQIGGKAALVADGGAQAALFQHALQRVKGFGDGAQTLAEGRQPHRHDHEFLEINGCIGMRAAVDDVRHGDGQHLGVGAAQIFEERQADERGGGLGVGQRDGEDGVGAELGLVRRAVEVEHDTVDSQLVQRIHAFERGKNLVGDVFDRLAHALAAETLGIAVAQFQRFEFARARAGRDRRAAHRATSQFHVNFNGRVSARIQNLARLNVKNGAHSSSSNKLTDGE